MIKRALCFGLEPYPLSGYVVDHCPLIEVVSLPQNTPDEILKKASHLLFTSKTAVDLFPYSVKPVLAIGLGTARRATEKGFNVISIAKDETQEGMCDLLNTLEEISLFWPRSDLARPIISEFCKKKGIQLFDPPIYTVKSKQVALPSLEKYDAFFLPAPAQSLPFSH